MRVPSTGNPVFVNGQGSDQVTNQNATAVNQPTGGGGAHANLPPYIVVYMWRRTA